MKKVFIGYSHVDEIHRLELQNHLAVLKRRGIISVWHDRKIIAGDDWKNKIDENLETADIILFLISSSFIASDYCIDVEMKKALENHRAGAAKIIPIILRACDWQQSDLSNLQAVPKDAVPITLWADEDSAWLDVVNSLKTMINEFAPNGKELSIAKNTKDVKLTATCTSWLDSTEIVLAHSKVDNVNLSNIYTSPDIELEYNKKKEIEIISSDKLLVSEGRYLIFGEEQQGKTTLLKNAYAELLKKGYLPIYVDASLVNVSNLKKTIENLISEQYEGMSVEEYDSIHKKVILIDNLDEVRLNQKYQNIFIQDISDQFEWVIATCHSSFNYVSSEIPALNKFEESKLLGFGNLKREEIVKKWVSLGVEELIEDKELYTKCDELKVYLNTVIKKNIVPSKPIYILMIIQMFEAYTQRNLELTSYGHCYQLLIYQSFEKAKIKSTEYDKYLNVLTELAWARFNQDKGLNQHQIDVFFKVYGEKYLPVNGNEIIEKLTIHSILSARESSIEFKYPYIYYFFVGKKIAEGFAESDEIKGKVDALLEKLHREDAANILIFITHHTKDSWVLTKINQVLASLFEDQEKASLEKNQLSFMGNFIKNIPQLVVEQREVQSERDKQNRMLDKIEREDEVLKDEQLDILVKINKTFKGMELAGQIIRNRHATMTKTALYSLADSGVASGLRFLNYFINISDEFKLELVKFIKSSLAEYPDLSNKEMEELAEGTYLQLTYNVINGVVRKIGHSIGSKEASEIYSSLEGNENTPAYTLINLTIDLQFTRLLKVATIENALEKLKKNPVCTRILKEIVIQHVYMFPVEYKVKQQLSQLLDLPVMSQRIMDNQKIGKA